MPPAATPGCCGHIAPVIHLFPWLHGKQNPNPWALPAKPFPCSAVVQRPLHPSRGPPSAVLHRASAAAGDLALGSQCWAGAFSGRTLEHLPGMTKDGPIPWAGLAPHAGHTWLGKPCLALGRAMPCDPGEAERNKAECIRGSALQRRGDFFFFFFT